MTYLVALCWSTQHFELGMLHSIFHHVALAPEMDVVGNGWTWGMAPIMTGHFCD
jgi:hypothetical protein